MLALYAIAFALILFFKPQLDRLGIGNLFVGVTGPAFAAVIEICGNQIKSYVPTSQHDAKIANEKIKLWITTLNSLGLALLVAGFAIPLIETIQSPSTGGAKLPTESLASFLLIAAGGFVHVRARSMFSYLKDEKAFEGEATAT